MKENQHALLILKVLTNQSLSGSSKTQNDKSTPDIKKAGRPKKIGGKKAKLSATDEVTESDGEKENADPKIYKHGPYKSLPTK